MTSDDPFDLPEGYGGVSSPQSPVPPEPVVPEPVVRAPEPVAPQSPASPPLSAEPQLPPFSGTIQREGGGLPPASPWPRRWKWIQRGLVLFVALILLSIVWLAFAAPISQSERPVVPPQMTLLDSGERPIARNGAIVDGPVDVTKLPPHVAEAFLAIEDRRFYSHWGVDPVGIARAAWANMTSGSRQGGSTITQQLAKITWLKADQTYSRKARELLMAWWLEAWLTKDEILSRYLSNAYFGDNVYGLRAASLHYFYRQPERLTVSQAAMLAGLVKAPSRLAPTGNIRGARARETVVLNAMVDAGYLTAEERRAIPLASTDTRARPSLPSGTYFADWAMAQARATVETGYGEQRVATTLDRRLQQIAAQVTGNANLNGAQVALVAMRPDGEVVAMVGGRSYAASTFNRATQARRQPGSTFKLIVYLAALRSGMTPDTLVDDSPITTGTYRPANAGGRYRGQITLREAFARSSNVAAVRLYTQLGSAAVEETARDLGITAPMPANASVALGSAEMTLMELTAAYAAIAGNYGPVAPHAIHVEEAGFFERLFDGRSSLSGDERTGMLDLLSAVVNQGTGRAARLAIPAYGKTGTSQDARDALFIGFAGDLVVGVWVGHDDNRPLAHVSGGGLPAQIWANFMSRAIPGAAPRPSPRPTPTPRSILDELPDLPDMPDMTAPEIRIDREKGVAVDAEIGGVGITIDREGVVVRDGKTGDGP